MKKVYTFIMAAILIAQILGCKKDIKTIAVIKYTNHPALNELEDSFLHYFDSLKASLPSFKNIKIEVFNANGNPQTAKELAEITTRSETKAIVAIATPAAQAVIRTKSNIPLFYGAVADPLGAGILPSNRATGIQNAGPSIIRRAICVIHEAFPKVKRIGTLYNPGEQNSVYVQKLISQFADSLKIVVISRTILDPTQISSLCEDLTSQVDLIYSANDNTVNAGVSTLVSICDNKKIPFVIGDLSTLSKGPCMAIGLEYKDLGISLGKQVQRFFQGESVTNIKPEGPPLPKVWINLKKINALGRNIEFNQNVKTDKIINQ
jgi:putative ABC transport system substrate-binding protein